MENCEIARGSDGNRCCNVNYLIAKCHEQILGEVSLDDWEKTLGNIPSLQKRIPKLFKHFLKAMSEKFEPKLEDIMEILDSNKAEASLCMREEFLKDQEQFRGTQAWRPSGVVEEDIVDHDISALLSIKRELEQKILQRKEVVANLREETDETRRKVSKMCANLEVLSEVL